jgi:hypothetical protein
MTRIDHLLNNFKRRASLPIRGGQPLSQRVWFLVYPPEEERRLLYRITEFDIAAQEVGLQWRTIDLTGSFAAWIDTFEDEDERLQILADPEILEEYAQTGFRDHIRDIIRTKLQEIPAEEMSRTALVLTGLMELYDLLHVSEIIDVLDQTFTGILLVFFPGEREGNTYRFLGARTGWDYLAVPILAEPN